MNGADASGGVSSVRLGLGSNLPQFALLVLINAFVGAMVGIERSILPALAEQEFRLVARAAILSFIVVFGIVKAFTNYVAGRLSDVWGRKAVLVGGWLIALPVPFLLILAPTWNWILFANALLGVSQGLTWSTTVIMKIDPGSPKTAMPSQGQIFLRTSFTDRNLSSVSQAGLVNNLNDGMAWGLFPLFFMAAGLSLERIAWLSAVYPAVWGVGQLFTGALSDRLGRKWPIAIGMWIQAAGIAQAALSENFSGFASGSVLLGVGTALVYPTLLAAIGDVAHPSWRASAVGVYRLWRDLGYAVGAILAGLAADALGVRASIGLVAAVTFFSGMAVALRMSETRGR